MNSEICLLTNYKQRHYDETKGKLMKVAVLMGLAGNIIGAVVALLTNVSEISVLLYLAGFVLIVIAGVLRYKKSVYGDRFVLAVMAYFCFVYVPVDWFTYGGLYGSTPYISLVLIVVIVLTLCGKPRKILLILYLMILAALSVHAIMVSINDVAMLSGLLVNALTFLIVAAMLSYSLLSLLAKYEKLYERFLNESIKDKLTGVYNRRVLDDVICLGEEQFKSNQTDYALAMLDIDRFKSLNDKFGHMAGDVVLQNFAQTIRKSVRSSDYVLRYGGDEFIIMLPNVSDKNVETVLEQIKQNIIRNPFVPSDFNITFSCGFVKRSECRSDKELVAAADRQMYADKEIRKNRYA